MTDPLVQRLRTAGERAVATVKARCRADGTLSFRVVWRAGGTRDGAWESETFASKSAAGRFRRDVDLCGQGWPDGWAKGVGYTPPPEPEPECAPAMSFVDFARVYVRDLTGVTPATRHRYDRMALLMSGQLSVVLCEEPTVANLQAVHVRRWVNAREAAGARPKTIANYHGLLFTVLAAAVRVGLRPGNPCAGTRLPDRYSPNPDGEGEVVFLTEAQFALIAEAMYPAHGLPAGQVAVSSTVARPARDGWPGTAADRALIEVAVGTGLRWSELTALQVRDLELDGPTPRLSVRRAWKRNPKGEFEVPDAGAFYLGAPKTKKSRRRLSLSPAVVALLRRAAAGKTPTALVFTAPRGGALNQATFYEDRWQRAVRLAHRHGLTVTPRFHDLRHSHAAWLISAGVPLPVIQQRLGHESITTTVDVYGGLLLQAHDVADAAIDAALGGRAVPAPRPLVAETG